MENFQVQLKNRIIAVSIPTNLSSDILESESHTCHSIGVLSAAANELLMAADSCGSPAVKSNADKGETCQTTDESSLGTKSNTHQDGGSTSTDKGFLVSENNTCLVGVLTPTNGIMGSDSCSSPAVKSKADKGDTTDKSSLGTKSNTYQDGGSTRRHRKGKGKKYRRTSQSNIYVDKGSPGKPFLAKVDFFRAVKSSKVVKGETCQTTESNTHQDDGSKTTTTDSEISQEGKGETCERTDVCSPDPESSTLQDDGSTASAAVLCGEFNCLTTTEGVSSQKIKIGIAESENNTHLDDGSTWTDKGFLVSENNTCHVDVSTTADGIVNEAISKDWEDGPYPATAIQQLQFRRSNYLHQFQMDLSERDTDRYDELTTKESISVRNDLKSVSPTIIEGKTPQRSDVPCPDSESNTPQEDADSQEVQGSSMESLPSDIVQDILCRVPAESVLECKLVCKRWETLASGSNFANMHLARQLNHLYDGDEGDDNLAVKVEPCLFFACWIADPDVIRTLLFNGGQLSDGISSKDGKYVYSQNLQRIYHPPMHKKRLYTHLVGSCNGLVCAFQHHHLVIDPIYIFNPLTREYVYLPQLVVRKEDVDSDRFRREGEGPELGGNMYGSISSGFGYVRSTNEYKVVRIHYLEYEEGNVEVYTLGSGCGWRSVGIIPYRLDTSSTGVCVNDAIYWTTYYKVVAFDLVKEEFRVLPDLPCMRDRQYDDRCGLVALGRHLCVYMDKLNVEIWSLMESEETWHMEYDIDYEAVVGSRGINFRPILLTKKGEIIFLYDGLVLYSYDTKTTFLKMISDEASSDYFCFVEVIAHMNTFTSLEAIGENSKRYTGRPRRVRTPWDDIINELDLVALGEEIDTTYFRLR